MPTVQLNNTPHQQARVSQARYDSVQKYFWNTDKCGHVLRPSTLPQFQFTIYQVPGDAKFQSLDQHIMGEILGRPVIEDIIHQDRDLLNLRRQKSLSCANTASDS
jgi:hypothetical protein